MSVTTKKQYITKVTIGNYNEWDSITSWTTYYDKFFTDINSLDTYLDEVGEYQDYDFHTTVHVIKDGTIRRMEHNDWFPVCGYYSPDPWSGEEPSF